AVLVKYHGDAIGVAVHRLVDGVVDDLPHQMVQPGRIDAADVHGRPSAHRLETLQDQDVLRGVARRHALPVSRPPRILAAAPVPPRAGAALGAQSSRSSCLASDTESRPISTWPTATATTPAIPTAIEAVPSNTSIMQARGRR